VTSGDEWQFFDDDEYVCDDEKGSLIPECLTLTHHPQARFRGISAQLLVQVATSP
jgi:hypothetical protein